MAILSDRIGIRNLGTKGILSDAFGCRRFLADEFLADLGTYVLFRYDIESINALVELTWRETNRSLSRILRVSKFRLALFRHVSSHPLSNRYDRSRVELWIDASGTRPLSSVLEIYQVDHVGFLWILRGELHRGELCYPGRSLSIGTEE